MSTELTTFETMLLSAIGVGLSGIGALITWIVKSAVPRILEAYSRKADALVAAVEANAQSIKSFELAMLSSEKRLSDKLIEVRDDITDRIVDKRLDRLEDHLRKSSSDLDAKTPPPKTRR